MSAPVSFLSANIDLLRPADILSVRLHAGLTQDEAAALVGLGSRTRWAEYENGTRRPESSRWELFLLKSGLHPEFTLRRRPNGRRSG